ncbi:MAG TPA: universal stress protein [Dehalococcoidia bacterium]|nr:universal stress protein [Dehalococcoidia bacterium]
MDKKILVPLDGSELAEVALPYAEELALGLGAGIELFRVVTLPVYSEPIGGVYTVEQEIVAKSVAREYLEKVGSRFKEKGVATRLEVICSTAAEGIIDCAANEEIDLVVLATHGHSGITRWAMGSVAYRVIRSTEKPIMLIRAKGQHPVTPGQGLVKKIVVPLDGSTESEAVIPHVSWLAAGLKAQVILFHALAGGYHNITVKGYEDTIYPEQQIASGKAFAEDYLTSIGKQLKEKGLVPTTEVRVGNAAEKIIDFASEVDADMVAMSTHGRSGVSRWIFGSVAEKVLHEGNKPLLLVRSPGARTQ